MIEIKLLNKPSNPYDTLIFVSQEIVNDSILRLVGCSHTLSCHIDLHSVESLMVCLIVYILCFPHIPCIEKLYHLVHHVVIVLIFPNISQANTILPNSYAAKKKSLYFAELICIYYGLTGKIC